MAALNPAETARLHIAEIITEIDAFRARINDRLAAVDAAILQEFPITQVLARPEPVVPTPTPVATPIMPEPAPVSTVSPFVPRTEPKPFVPDPVAKPAGLSPVPPGAKD